MILWTSTVDMCIAGRYRIPEEWDLQELNDLLALHYSYGSQSCGHRLMVLP